MAETTGNITELDIRGQICPSTLLTALKYLNQYQVEIHNDGMQIVILTSNRDSTATIPQAAANMGYKTQVDKEDGYYKITIS